MWWNLFLSCKQCIHFRFWWIIFFLILFLDDKIHRIWNCYPMESFQSWLSIRDNQSISTFSNDKEDFPQVKIHHYQKEIKYELFRCQHPEVVSSNLFRFYKSSNIQGFKNVFRVFDQDSSGAIRFHELLLAFSMSMRGSGNNIALWPRCTTLYDIMGQWPSNKHFFFNYCSYIKT